MEGLEALPADAAMREARLPGAVEDRGQPLAVSVAQECRSWLAEVEQGPQISSVPISDDATTPEFDHLRGTSLDNVEDFFNVQLKEMLSLEEVSGKLRIVSQVLSVTPRRESMDSGFIEVKTDGPHRLYRFDAVNFDGVTGSDGENIGRLLNGNMFRVTATPGPETFHIGVDAGSCGPGTGGSIWTPTNMYKACPEVVIPRTITEERLVLVDTQATLDLLRDSMDPEGADLTLARPTELPDASGRVRTVREGLTVHGRLSTLGTFRGGYWSLGDKRAAAWRTTGAHGRCMVDAEPAPAGVREMEDRNWSLNNIKVGDTLVLRRGVAYSELFGPGTVDDFVSHWWGEDSHDFIVTLRNHEKDAVKKMGGAYGGRRKYICTFSNRQHRVELGSWDDWKSFVFNTVLLHVKNKGGNVLVALGSDAMCLERVWCIFEAWVCASQDITYFLYSTHGELRSCLDAGMTQALKLKDKLSKLDLRAAQCSVQMDRVMILRLVDDSVGGIAHVEYIVKRSVLTTQEIAVSLQRVCDPLTGHRLQVRTSAEPATDVIPAHIMQHRGQLARAVSKPLRPLSVQDMHEQLGECGGSGGIWSKPVLVVGPAGSGKSTLTTEIVHLAGSSSDVLKIPMLQLALPLAERKGAEHADIDLLQVWAEARFGAHGDDELLGYAGDGGVEGGAAGTQDITLLLDDMHEVSDLCLPALLLWLRRWVQGRRSAGRRDRILITSRPESVKMPEVKQLLRNMGFAKYELQPMAPDLAEQISGRISKESGCAAETARHAMDRLKRLPSELREWPLMSTFAAHYCSRSSAQMASKSFSEFSTPEAAATGFLEQPKHAGVEEVYRFKASVLKFVADELVKQALLAAALPLGASDGLDQALHRLAFLATMRSVKLGPRFVAVKAINAAAMLTGAESAVGNERWQRSPSRALTEAMVEEACVDAGLDKDKAKQLFTAAVRGEIHVLEPADAENCVRFTQLCIQDYMASAYAYQQPGDQEPYSSLWASIASWAISHHDMLGEVRSNLCMLMIAKVPRAEGVAPPMWRLQFACRQGHQDAVRFLIREGLGRADTADDMVNAVCTTVEFARTKDLVPIVFAVTKAMTAVEIIKSFSSLVFVFIWFAWHPAWLLLAAALVHTHGGDLQHVALPLILAGNLSWWNMWEALMNPFRLWINWPMLVVWCAQSVKNFMLLPLVLVGIAVFTALNVVISACFLPGLLVAVLHIVPSTSTRLGQLPKAVRISFSTFLLLANVLAAVTLVLQSEGIGD